MHESFKNSDRNLKLGNRLVYSLYNDELVRGDVISE